MPAIFNLLPGIPPDATQAASSFWESFWPSLYAGLISGVIYSSITGLIVGLLVGQALFKIQERSERNRLTNEYERDFSQFEEKLKYTYTLPDPIMIGKAVEMAPRCAKELYDMLRNHPVSAWETTLSGKTKKFNALSEFRNKYLAFLTKASHLDTHLAQTIRSHNAEKRVNVANDNGLHIYLLARSIGLSHEAVLPWIQWGSPSDDDLSICQQGEIAKILTEWKLTRDNLFTEIGIIKIPFNILT